MYVDPSGTIVLFILVATYFTQDIDLTWLADFGNSFLDFLHLLDPVMGLFAGLLNGLTLFIPKVLGLFGNFDWSGSFSWVSDISLGGIVDWFSGLFSGLSQLPTLILNILLFGVFEWGGMGGGTGGENYTKEVSLKNEWRGLNLCVSTQGFAMGAYAYSIKISNNEKAHNLYRHVPGSGMLTPMIPINNPDNGNPVGLLGHANDMTLVTYNDTSGVQHLCIYVVAADSEKYNNLKKVAYLVKLEYRENNGAVEYFEVARYKYKNWSFGGVANMKEETNANGEKGVRLLLMRGGKFNTVFTTFVKYDEDDEAELDVDPVFIVDRGTPYTDYNSTQGIHYRNDTLYLTLWEGNGDDNKNNNSVILQYKGVDDAIAATQKDNTYRKQHNGKWELKGAPGRQFEIEGCGIRYQTDQIWFNTNQYRNAALGIGAGGIYTVDSLAS